MLNMSEFFHNPLSVRVKHIGEVLRLMKSIDLNYDDGVMMVIGCMLIIVIHVVESFACFDV